MLREGIGAFSEAFKFLEVFTAQIAKTLSDLLLKRCHIALEMEDVTTFVS